jgi:hypothetical protein
MNKVKKEVLSKIPNELFYVEDEKHNYSYKESILYRVGYDDKVILVLHELFLNTTLRNECLITLDYLIEKCYYKTDKDNRKSFKNTLNTLKNIKLINFNEINKSNELIIIYTQKLMESVSDNYIVFNDKELEVFKTIIDTRNRNTLIKLYLYLKDRIYKEINNEDMNLRYTPQVKYQTYECIAKYTGLVEARIKEYMYKLQELNLIAYKDINKNINVYKDDKIVIISHPIIYAINNFQENIDIEIQNGIEFYKNKLINDNYSITYLKDNDYKIYYDDLESLNLKGLYLIRNIDNNKIKIGICSNLSRRFSEIENSFKFCGIDPNIKIECFIECIINYDLEQYLHKEFKEMNYQNEWFDIDNIGIILDKIKWYFN